MDFINVRGSVIKCMTGPCPHSLPGSEAMLLSLRTALYLPTNGAGKLAQKSPPRFAVSGKVMMSLSGEYTALYRKGIIVQNANRTNKKYIINLRNLAVS